MNETQKDPSTPGTPENRSAKGLLLKVVLPLLVIAAALGLSFWLTESGPKTVKRPRPRHATLVETVPVTLGSERPVLTAKGTVVPAAEIELKPRVDGRIIELDDDMIPGGRVRRGQLLVTIDPSDYRLQLRQAKSAVVRAAAELQLELGNQLLAQKELELLGSVVNDEEKELMLRQPQLKSLQAALDSARAAEDRAQLDLERTRVVAPFNGTVSERHVSVGAQVTPSTVLATLVDNDRYWVDVLLPTDRLRWIDIPIDNRQEGSGVRIRLASRDGGEVVYQGRLLRLLPQVEDQGKMAQLLVEVTDPLAQGSRPDNRSPLLLGAWVTVEIDGRILSDVVAIDRAWLHDGDRVWLRDAEGRLEIRPVKVAFRDLDRVLVSDGLAPGEELVVSRLPAPVEGMSLRTDSDKTPPAGEQTTNREAQQ